MLNHDDVPLLNHDDVPLQRASKPLDQIRSGAPKAEAGVAMASRHAV
jgi:hypothetical protein